MEKYQHLKEIVMKAATEALVEQPENKYRVKYSGELEQKIKRKKMRSING